ISPPGRGERETPARRRQGGGEVPRGLWFRLLYDGCCGKTVKPRWAVTPTRIPINGGLTDEYVGCHHLTSRNHGPLLTQPKPNPLDSPSIFHRELNRRLLLRLLRLPPPKNRRLLATAYRLQRMAHQKRTLPTHGPTPRNPPIPPMGAKSFSQRPFKSSR